MSSIIIIVSSVFLSRVILIKFAYLFAFSIKLIGTDYGLAQARKRIFILGIKKSIIKYSISENELIEKMDLLLKKTSYQKKILIY